MSTPSPSANGQLSARAHPGRFWTRVLIVSTLTIALAAVAYDLYPSLVLPYRVDDFLEVVEMGAQREEVDAELRARGFDVPEWYKHQGDVREIYLIRSREPLIERVADAVALSVNRDAWWASKKYPHHAYVTYDTSNTVSGMELNSQFNPLWY